MRVPGLLAGTARKLAILHSGWFSPYGKHNTVGRSNWNKRIYSSRNKTAAYNTMVVVNHRGQIMRISTTVTGSTRDLTLLKKNLPDLDALTKLMLDRDAPPKRPMVVAARDS